MGLDLTLLTAEAGPSPEANVFGLSRPNKLGGHQPPRSMYTRMQDCVERDEQLIAKRRRNQRPQRSEGHITEDQGL